MKNTYPKEVPLLKKIFKSFEINPAICKNNRMIVRPFIFFSIFSAGIVSKVESCPFSKAFPKLVKSKAPGQKNGRKKLWTLIFIKLGLIIALLMFDPSIVQTMVQKSVDILPDTLPKKSLETGLPITTETACQNSPP